MSEAISSSGATLSGVERLAVFSRLRAFIGLRWEMRPLLEGVELEPTARCLELGTGLGWGTTGLLRANPSLRVVSTDYEAAIIPVGRSFIRENHPHATVSFARADAKLLPFRNDTFDVVLCLYVLHHAAGYRAALYEIARVTRGGGRLLFIDLVRPTLIPKLPRKHAPDGLLTRQEWQSLVSESGFILESWRSSNFLGLFSRCVVKARRT
jgi:ubiquinone/menaquinone biosynthesis C-methylase UbiE